MEKQKLFFIEDLNELFTDVQTQRVFVDQKRFVDAAPKYAPEQVLANYKKQRQEANFDFKHFLETHFILPEPIHSENTQQKTDIQTHINRLWHTLTKTTPAENGTLIQLPYPYVVPGGRFIEFFYWDSYFISLGLQAQGHFERIEHTLKNMAYLIDEFGFIPNANRSYFLSRSQPPFFSLTVALFAQIKGEQVYVDYLPQLKKEYAFWMDGVEDLTKGKAYKHIVKLKDGEILNRYWDTENTPRPESFFEDTELAQRNPHAAELFRDIRAACSSGWDFSGRWFENPYDMATIQTTSLIPVDLNSLLWHLETTLEKAATISGITTEAANYQTKAKQRAAAIDKYLWNSSQEVYQDYHFIKECPSPVLSLAMAFPLAFNLSSAQQAKKVLNRLTHDFLKEGGLISTLINSGQQWDAPNGWAPLQWMAYQAAMNYKDIDLAKKIAQNWVNSVERVYDKTGKIMEKYNVVDTSLLGGGGEYPNQDGFGWTNGVYTQFKQQLNLI